jgi:FkbM family methyltransferase
MLKFNDSKDWLKGRIIGVEKAYYIPPKFNGFFGVAVDIGANVGAFPVVNHKKFSRIICIEPSEYSYNECIKNTKEFNNVEVYKFAVSNTSDKLVKLKSYKEANFSGNASTLDSDLWDDNNFELVKTISFDDILKKFNLIKIDYLKIDCEGGEYDFLMNKNLLNINYLAIEIHIQLKEKALKIEQYLKNYFIPMSEFGDGINMHKEITFKNKLL